MKFYIMILSLLAGSFCFGQSTYPIRADTVKIYKQGGFAELILQNSTKDSTGVLVNLGNGVTTFLKSRKINDSTIVIGKDTLTVGSGSGHGGDSSLFLTIYRNDTAKQALRNSLAGKVTNSGGGKFLGSGLYASKPAASTGPGFYYATDSARLYYTDGASYSAATDKANQVFNLYIKKDGGRGVNIGRGADSSIYLKGLVDSGAFHFYLNPDSTITGYVATSGGGLTAANNLLTASAGTVTGGGRSTQNTIFNFHNTHSWTIDSIGTLIINGLPLNTNSSGAYSLAIDSTGHNLMMVPKQLIDTTGASSITAPYVYWDNTVKKFRLSALPTGPYVFQGNYVIASTPGDTTCLNCTVPSLANVTDSGSLAVNGAIIGTNTITTNHDSTQVRNTIVNYTGTASVKNQNSVTLNQVASGDTTAYTHVDLNIIDNNGSRNGSVTGWNLTYRKQTTGGTKQNFNGVVIGINPSTGDSILLGSFYQMNVFNPAGFDSVIVGFDNPNTGTFNNIGVIKSIRIRDQTAKNTTTGIEIGINKGTNKKQIDALGSGDIHFGGRTTVDSPLVIKNVQTGTGTPTVLVHMPDSSVGQMPYPSSGGAPGGATTQVQINDAGAFYGNSGLTYNKTNRALSADTVNVHYETADSSKFNNFHSFYDVDSLLHFGHSIPQGTGSYDGFHGFCYMLDTFYNKPFRNLSVGGTGTISATGIALAQEDNRTAKYGITAMIGTNDLGNNGPVATTYNMILDGIKSIYANHFTKDTITASWVGNTRTGTWTTYTGKATDGAKSTTVLVSGVQNSSVTYTSAADSSIIVGMMDVDGNTGVDATLAPGVAKITIDGVQVARVSFNPVRIIGAAGHRLPVAFVFSGLAYTTHTVVVSNDSSGGYIYVDWFGHLKDVKNCYPMLLVKDVYKKAAGYTGSLTPASYDTLGIKYDSLAATLPRGYPLRLGNSNTNFDPTIYISADNVHPTEAGHRVIFNNCVVGLSPNTIGTTTASGNITTQTRIADASSNKKTLPIALNNVGVNYIGKGNVNGVLESSGIKDDGNTFLFMQQPGAAQQPVLLKDNVSGLGFFGVNYQTQGILQVNENPISTVFTDAGKSSSRLALVGNSGASQIIFYTASANNTPPTQRASFEGNGRFLVGSSADQATGLTQITANGQAQMAYHYSSSIYTQVFTDANGNFQIIPTGKSTTFAAATSVGPSVIVPLGAQPSTTVEGSIYTSSSTHHAYIYLSGSWQQIDQQASSGITSLNTLTGSTQTFATGTGGTDFGISSTGTTHTFNMPDASGSARGLITTGTQTLAGVKTFSSSPIMPTASAGDNSTKGSTTAYADNAASTAVAAIGAASNTFTSTVTNNANGTSVTFRSASYMKSGNIVSATIVYSVTSTVSGAEVGVNFSLPVTTSVTTQNWVGEGSAYMSGAANTSVQASITSGTGGVCFFWATGTNTYNVTLHLMYSL